jgi:hypothetical protein
MSNLAVPVITQKSFPYDQYAGHQVASATLTGNSSVVLLTAPVPVQAFAVQATVEVAGAVGGNVTVFHITANNGSNTFSNTAVGNVIAVGAATAGNTFTSGPLTFTPANGFIAGGVSLAPGDQIIAVSSGDSATGSFGLALEYAIAPGATITA